MDEGHVSDHPMDEQHVSDHLVDEGHVSVYLGNIFDSLMDGCGCDTLMKDVHYLTLPLDVSQWNDGLGVRQSKMVPPLLNDECG